MAGVQNTFTLNDEYELSKKDLDQKYMEGFEDYQNYLKAYIISPEFRDKIDLLEQYCEGSEEVQSTMRAALRANYSSMFQ